MTDLLGVLKDEKCHSVCKGLMTSHQCLCKHHFHGYTKRNENSSILYRERAGDFEGMEF